MNKITVLKFATRFVVGVGTTTISNSIIRNNVAPANLLQQVSVGLASVVIGSMAADATGAHTDAQIDHVVDAWNNAKNTDDPAIA